MPIGEDAANRSESQAEAMRSINLLMELRFEIGRKFWSSSQSRPFFLSTAGVTTAFLQEVGNKPELKERLTISVNKYSTVSSDLKIIFIYALNVTIRIPQNKLEIITTMIIVRMVNYVN